MTQKGDILTERQLDNAVYALAKHALSVGMIPIAGIMSRRQRDGRHEVLGFGWNRLREGIPGIHGETGAIMNMGRIRTGYADLTATSSLSPCPFCQCCLALHMGVKDIRILDATNYKPDLSGYAKVGLTPAVSEHAGIIKLFRKWVNDPANALIWNRDIGIYPGKTGRPFDASKNRGRVRELILIANSLASQGLAAGEAPVGAIVVDAFGEVIGAGHPRILLNNDPSMVAAMSAWRACGARDHWKDKTLILTCGPDHIAYSTFHIFNFGQLIVGSDAVFRGRIDDVRKLGRNVAVLKDSSTDRLLKRWTAANPSRAREYLGPDFRAA